MKDEVFSFQFGTQTCKVICKSNMKFWTASYQTVSLCTGSCRAKPWLALPNHHVRSLFFWDITKCWVVIPYGRFRTTYWSHLQESRNPKEHSMSEFNWNNLLFWDFVHDLNLIKKNEISEASSVFIYKQRNTFLVDLLDWGILSHWVPQKQELKICTKGSNRKMAVEALKINKAQT